MDTNNTAIAVIENFNLPALTDEMGQALAEEMDGLTLNFPRVKIPSGGGLAFEVPGDDPDSPEIVKEIIGVIVDHYPVNAYWEKAYTGGNVPPDCSSMDAKNGDYGSCASCSFNQWGSDPKDGKGKACKNMHRVYILREGEVLPLLLTLPPTTLKNFSDYIGLRVVTKGYRSHAVITKVGLKKAQNAGGIDYSQAVFALAGKLSPQQTESMADYAQGIKATTRQVAIGAEEYMQTRSGGQDADIDYTASSGDDEERF